MIPWAARAVLTSLGSWPARLKATMAQRRSPKSCTRAPGKAANRARQRLGELCEPGLDRRKAPGQRAVDRDAESDDRGIVELPVLEAPRIVPQLVGVGGAVHLALCRSGQGGSRCSNRLRRT